MSNGFGWTPESRYSRRHGTWRSLAARSVRDAEVAGSNPAVPTRLGQNARAFRVPGPTVERTVHDHRPGCAAIQPADRRRRLTFEETETAAEVPSPAIVREQVQPDTATPAVAKAQSRTSCIDDRDASARIYRGKTDQLEIARRSRHPPLGRRPAERRRYLSPGGRVLIAHRLEMPIG